MTFKDYFKRKIPVDGRQGAVFWYTLPLANRLWNMKFSTRGCYKISWQYRRLKHSSNVVSACFDAMWG